MCNRRVWSPGCFTPEAVRFEDLQGEDPSESKHSVSMQVPNISSCVRYRCHPRRLQAQALSGPETMSKTRLL